MKAKIPSQLQHLISKTVWHYFEAKEGIQRLVDNAVTLQGRWGDKYVMQMSHGTQQIKRYEPHKYKNEVNTPLRTRVRTIIKLANQDPTPCLTEKMRELFRTYPFYLDKDIPINLRLKNFYFEEAVRPDDKVRIYKMSASEPDTVSDELYWKGDYIPKKTVKFSYSEADIEKYYAVNQRSGEISNVVRMEWQ